MRKVLAVLPFAALASVCLAAPAARADPAAQIKTRQQGMKQIGAAMKALGQQARGTPDMAVVGTQAAAMKRLSTAQLDWFPKGSGPETGLKTHAKAAIWADPAGFRTAQQAFVAEAAKLAAVTDAAALPAQVKALGGTCKGCHEKFKESED